MNQKGRGEKVNNNSVIQIWEDFQKNVSNAPDTYEAWAFGDSKEMADDLAALVAAGVKTATSSNYLLYEKNELLPYVGLHNIILDGDEQAVAIVENTAVEIVPFNEVTKEHAFLEGEGSRTLKYWRDAHEEFFKNEMTGSNQTFHHEIPVVCERFKVVYKNK